MNNEPKYIPLNCKICGELKLYADDFWNEDVPLIIPCNLYENYFHIGQLYKRKNGEKFTKTYGKTLKQCFKKEMIEGMRHYVFDGAEMSGHILEPFLGWRHYK